LIADDRNLDHHRQIKFYKSGPFNQKRNFVNILLHERSAKMCC
jgi:hypothetical protein